MIIKEDEYEIVGYVKRTCVCEKCMCEMLPTNLELTCNPPKRIMKCQVCGKEEAIDVDALNGHLKIIKKVVE